MTSEVQFAKSFLSALDSKPIKLQSDYATDLKSLQLKGPYTLPRMPNAMTKPENAAAPGSDPAVKVALKSTKNPPLDISIPAVSLNTSVLDLKQKVASEVGLESTDKIRFLYKKKPASDAKSIKDVIGDGKETTVEFSVMILGGVPEKPTTVPSSANNATDGDSQMTDAPVAQGESGTTVMQSADFWSDLQGFLEQRVKDSAVAERATKLFAEVWKEKGGLL